MIELNDSKWKGLKGGYKINYDASEKLRELEETDDPSEMEEVFKELWENLYHQGDVGLASYHALPQLIRIGIKKSISNWNIPGLLTAIELARQENNPNLPEDDVKEYETEIKEITRWVYLNQNKEMKENEFAISLSSIAVINKKFEYAKLLMEMSGIDSKYIEAFAENIEPVSEWMENQGFVKGTMNDNQMKMF